MIATVAQYKVTEDRVTRFEAALATLDASDASPLGVFRRRTIRDAISALEEELGRYDRLASGEVETIVVERLADLPRALVEARIVAGLDQRALARASGTSAIALERWERNGYSKAAIETMMAIARVLPIEMRVGAERARPSRTLIARGLDRAGVPREIRERILDVDGLEGYAASDEVDLRLAMLLGAKGADFVGGYAFSEPALRFRLPANAEQKRTRAYATYVEKLSEIVASTQKVSIETLPDRWPRMRAALFPTGKIDLGTAVRRCWAMGIGVLPLRDPVAFNGACRRSDGKATIVLAQASRHQSRWLFDLVHEMFHLVAEPEDFTLLEANETATERRQSQLERRADRFAAMVLTNGRLPDALIEVGRLSGGQIARLSSAVAATAASLEIPVGILANLVAENVQTHNKRNWWGAAQNLQPEEDDAWKTVRDVFLREGDLDRLNGTEAAFVRGLMETRDD